MFDITTTGKLALFIALPTTFVLLYLLLRHTDVGRHLLRRGKRSARFLSNRLNIGQKLIADNEEEEEEKEGSKRSKSKSSTKITEIKIPSYATSTIIGRERSTLHTLQNSFNVEIDVKEEGDTLFSTEDQILYIRGSLEAIQQTELRIQQIISHISTVTSEDMYIPSSSTISLTGNDNQIVQYINRVSGAKVLVDTTESRDPQNMQLISIEGSRDQIEHAKKLINDSVDKNLTFQEDLTSQCINSDTETHLTHTVSHTTSTREHRVPQTLPTENSPTEFLELMVVSVSSPGHFWAHIRNENLPKLVNLQKDIEEFYTDSNNFERYECDEVAVDDVVAVCLTNQSQWYRARVTALLTNSYKVFCVDYGYNEEIPKENVCRLREDFLSLPYQAVECYLANIKPKDNRDWTQSACNTFENMVCMNQSKILSGEIIRYQHTSRGLVPCLQLIDYDGPQVSWCNLWLRAYTKQAAAKPSNINEELVKMGHAEWKTSLGHKETVGKDKRCTISQEVLKSEGFGSTESLTDPFLKSPPTEETTVSQPPANTGWADDFPWAWAYNEEESAPGKNVCEMQTRLSNIHSPTVEIQQHGARDITSLQETNALTKKTSETSDLVEHSEDKDGNTASKAEEVSNGFFYNGICSDVDAGLVKVTSDSSVDHVTNTDSLVESPSANENKIPKYLGRREEISPSSDYDTSDIFDSGHVSGDLSISSPISETSHGFDHESLDQSDLECVVHSQFDVTRVVKSDSGSGILDLGISQVSQDSYSTDTFGSSITISRDDVSSDLDPLKGDQVGFSQEMSSLVLKDGSTLDQATLQATNLKESDPLYFQESSVCPILKQPLKTHDLEEKDNEIYKLENTGEKLNSLGANDIVSRRDTNVQKYEELKSSEKLIPVEADTNISLLNSDREQKTNQEIVTSGEAEEASLQSTGKPSETNTSDSVDAQFSRSELVTNVFSHTETPKDESELNNFGYDSVERKTDIKMIDTSSSIIVDQSDNVPPQWRNLEDKTNLVSSSVEDTKDLLPYQPLTETLHNTICPVTTPSINKDSIFIKTGLTQPEIEPSSSELETNRSLCKTEEVSLDVSTESDGRSNPIDKIVQTPSDSVNSNLDMDVWTKFYSPLEEDNDWNEKPSLILEKPSKNNDTVTHLVKDGSTQSEPLENEIEHEDIWKMFYNPISNKDWEEKALKDNEIWKKFYETDEKNKVDSKPLSNRNQYSTDWKYTVSEPLEEERRDLYIWSWFYSTEDSLKSDGDTETIEQKTISQITKVGSENKISDDIEAIPEKLVETNVGGMLTTSEAVEEFNTGLTPLQTDSYGKNLEYSPLEEDNNWEEKDPSKQQVSIYHYLPLDTFLESWKDTVSDPLEDADILSGDDQIHSGADIKQDTDSKDIVLKPHEISSIGKSTEDIVKERSGVEITSERMEPSDENLEYSALEEDNDWEEKDPSVILVKDQYEEPVDTFLESWKDTVSDPLEDADILSGDDQIPSGVDIKQQDTDSKDIVLKQAEVPGIGKSTEDRVREKSGVEITSVRMELSDENLEYSALEEDNDWEQKDPAFILVKEEVKEPVETFLESWKDTASDPLEDADILSGDDQIPSGCDIKQQDTDSKDIVLKQAEVPDIGKSTEDRVREKSGVEITSVRMEPSDENLEYSALDEDNDWEEKDPSVILVKEEVKEPVDTFLESWKDTVSDPLEDADILSSDAEIPKDHTDDNQQDLSKWIFSEIPDIGLPTSENVIRELDNSQVISIQMVSSDENLEYSALEEDNDWEQKDPSVILVKEEVKEPVDTFEEFWKDTVSDPLEDADILSVDDQLHSGADIKQDTDSKDIVLKPHEIPCIGKSTENIVKERSGVEITSVRMEPSDENLEYSALEEDNDWEEKDPSKQQVAIYHYLPLNTFLESWKDTVSDPLEDADILSGDDQIPSGVDIKQQDTDSKDIVLKQAEVPDIGKSTEDRVRERSGVEITSERMEPSDENLEYSALEEDNDWEEKDPSVILVKGPIEEPVDTFLESWKDTVSDPLEDADILTGDDQIPSGVDIKQQDTDSKDIVLKQAEVPSIGKSTEDRIREKSGVEITSERMEPSDENLEYSALDEDNDWEEKDPSVNLVKGPIDEPVDTFEESWKDTVSDPLEDADILSTDHKEYAEININGRQYDLSDHSESVEDRTTFLENMSFTDNYSVDRSESFLPFDSKMCTIERTSKNISKGFIKPQEFFHLDTTDAPSNIGQFEFSPTSDAPFSPSTDSSRIKDDSFPSDKDISGKSDSDIETEGIMYYPLESEVLDDDDDGDDDDHVDIDDDNLWLSMLSPSAGNVEEEEEEKDLPDKDHTSLDIETSSHYQSQTSTEAETMTNVFEKTSVQFAITDGKLLSETEMVEGADEEFCQKDIKVCRELSDKEDLEFVDAEEELKVEFVDADDGSKTEESSSSIEVEYSALEEDNDWEEKDPSVILVKDQSEEPVDTFVESWKDTVSDPLEDADILSGNDQIPSEVDTIQDTDSKDIVLKQVEIPDIGKSTEDRVRETSGVEITSVRMEPSDENLEYSALEEDNDWEEKDPAFILVKEEDKEPVDTFLESWKDTVSDPLEDADILSGDDSENVLQSRQTDIVPKSSGLPHMEEWDSGVNIYVSVDDIENELGITEEPRTLLPTSHEKDVPVSSVETVTTESDESDVWSMFYTPMASGDDNILEYSALEEDNDLEEKDPSVILVKEEHREPVNTFVESWKDTVSDPLEDADILSSDDQIPSGIDIKQQDTDSKDIVLKQAEVPGIGKSTEDRIRKKSGVEITSERMEPSDENLEYSALEEDNDWEEKDASVILVKGPIEEPVDTFLESWKDTVSDPLEDADILSVDDQIPSGVDIKQQDTDSKDIVLKQAEVPSIGKSTEDIVKERSGVEITSERMEPSDENLEYSALEEDNDWEEKDASVILVKGPLEEPVDTFFESWKDTVSDPLEDADILSGDDQIPSGVDIKQQDTDSKDIVLKHIGESIEDRVKERSGVEITSERMEPSDENLEYSALEEDNDWEEKDPSVILVKGPIEEPVDTFLESWKDTVSDPLEDADILTGDDQIPSGVDIKQQDTDSKDIVLKQAEVPSIGKSTEDRIREKSGVEITSERMEPSDENLEYSALDEDNDWEEKDPSVNLVKGPIDEPVDTFEESWKDTVSDPLEDADILSTDHKEYAEININGRQYDLSDHSESVEDRTTFLENMSFTDNYSVDRSESFLPFDSKMCTIERTSKNISKGFIKPQEFFHLDTTDAPSNIGQFEFSPTSDAPFSPSTDSSRIKDDSFPSDKDISGKSDSDIETEGIMYYPLESEVLDDDDDGDDDDHVDIDDDNLWLSMLSPSAGNVEEEEEEKDLPDKDHTSLDIETSSHYQSQTSTEAETMTNVFEKTSVQFAITDGKLLSETEMVEGADEEFCQKDIKVCRELSDKEDLEFVDAEEELKVEFVDADDGSKTEESSSSIEVEYSALEEDNDWEEKDPSVILVKDQSEEPVDTFVESWKDTVSDPLEDADILSGNDQIPSEVDTIQDTDSKDIVLKQVEIPDIGKSTEDRVRETSGVEITSVRMEPSDENLEYSALEEDNDWEEKDPAFILVKEKDKEPVDTFLESWKDTVSDPLEDADILSGDDQIPSGCDIKQQDTDSKDIVLKQAEVPGIGKSTEDRVRETSGVEIKSVRMEPSDENLEYSALEEDNDWEEKDPSVILVKEEDKEPVDTFLESWKDTVSDPLEDADILSGDDSENVLQSRQTDILPKSSGLPHMEEWDSGDNIYVSVDDIKSELGITEEPRTLLPTSHEKDVTVSSIETVTTESDESDVWSMFYTPMASGDDNVLEYSALEKDNDWEEKDPSVILVKDQSEEPVDTFVESWKDTVSDPLEDADILSGDDQIPSGVDIKQEDTDSKDIVLKQAEVPSIGKSTEDRVRETSGVEITSERMEPSDENLEYSALDEDNDWEEKDTSLILVKEEVKEPAETFLESWKDTVSDPLEDADILSSDDQIPSGIDIKQDTDSKDIVLKQVEIPDIGKSTEDRVRETSGVEITSVRMEPSDENLEYSALDEDNDWEEKDTSLILVKEEVKEPAETFLESWKDTVSDPLEDADILSSDDQIPSGIDIKQDTDSKDIVLKQVEIPDIGKSNEDRVRETSGVEITSVRMETSDENLEYSALDEDNDWEEKDTSLIWVKEEVKEPVETFLESWKDTVSDPLEDADILSSDDQIPSGIDIKQDTDSKDIVLKQVEIPDIGKSTEDRVRERSGVEITSVRMEPSDENLEYSALEEDNDWEEKDPSVILVKEEVKEPVETFLESWKDTVSDPLEDADILSGDDSENVLQSRQTDIVPKSSGLPHMEEWDSGDNIYVSVDDIENELGITEEPRTLLPTSHEKDVTVSSVETVTTESVESDVWSMFYTPMASGDDNVLEYAALEEDNDWEEKDPSVILVKEEDKEPVGTFLESWKDTVSDPLEDADILSGDDQIPSGIHIKQQDTDSKDIVLKQAEVPGIGKSTEDRVREKSGVEITSVRMEPSDENLEYSALEEDNDWEEKDPDLILVKEEVKEPVDTFLESWKDTVSDPLEDVEYDSINDNDSMFVSESEEGNQPSLQYFAGHDYLLDQLNHNFKEKKSLVTQAVNTDDNEVWNMYFTSHDKDREFTEIERYPLEDVENVKFQLHSGMEDFSKESLPSEVSSRETSVSPFSFEQFKETALDIDYGIDHREDFNWELREQIANDLSLQDRRYCLEDQPDFFSSSLDSWASSSGTMFSATPAHLSSTCVSDTENAQFMSNSDDEYLDAKDTFYEDETHVNVNIPYTDNQSEVNETVTLFLPADDETTKTLNKVEQEKAEALLRKHIIEEEISLLLSEIVAMASEGTKRTEKSKLSEQDVKAEGTKISQKITEIIQGMVQSNENMEGKVAKDVNAIIPQDVNLTEVQDTMGSTEVVANQETFSDELLVPSETETKYVTLEVTEQMEQKLQNVASLYSNYAEEIPDTQLMLKLETLYFIEKMGKSEKKDNLDLQRHVESCNHNLKHQNNQHLDDLKSRESVDQRQQADQSREVLPKSSSNENEEIFANVLMVELPIAEELTVTGDHLQEHPDSSITTAKDNETCRFTSTLELQLPNNNTSSVTNIQDQKVSVTKTDSVPISKRSKTKLSPGDRIARRWRRKSPSRNYSNALFVNVPNYSESSEEEIHKDIDESPLDNEECKMALRHHRLSEAGFPIETHSELLKRLSSMESDCSSSSSCEGFRCTLHTFVPDYDMKNYHNIFVIPKRYGTFSTEVNINISDPKERDHHDESSPSKKPEKTNMTLVSSPEEVLSSKAQSFSKLTSTSKEEESVKEETTLIKITDEKKVNDKSDDRRNSIVIDFMTDERRNDRMSYFTEEQIQDMLEKVNQKGSVTQYSKSGYQTDCHSFMRENEYRYGTSNYPHLMNYPPQTEPYWQTKSSDPEKTMLLTYSEMLLSSDIVSSKLVETPTTDDTVCSKLVETPTTDDTVCSKLVETPTTDDTVCSKLVETPTTDDTVCSKLVETPTTDEVVSCKMTETHTTDDNDSNIIDDNTKKTTGVLDSTDMEKLQKESQELTQTSEQLAIDLSSLLSVDSSEISNELSHDYVAKRPKSPEDHSESSQETSSSDSDGDYPSNQHLILEFGVENDVNNKCAEVLLADISSDEVQLHSEEVREETDKVALIEPNLSKTIVSAHPITAEEQIPTEEFPEHSQCLTFQATEEISEENSIIETGVDFTEGLHDKMFDDVSGFVDRKENFFGITRQQINRPLLKYSLPISISQAESSPSLQEGSRCETSPETLSSYVDICQMKLTDSLLESENKEIFADLCKSKECNVNQPVDLSESQQVDKKVDNVNVLESIEKEFDITSVSSFEESSVIISDNSLNEKSMSDKYDSEEKTTPITLDEVKSNITEDILKKQSEDNLSDTEIKLKQEKPCETTQTLSEEFYKECSGSESSEVVAELPEELKKQEDQFTLSEKQWATLDEDQRQEADMCGNYSTEKETDTGIKNTGTKNKKKKKQKRKPKFFALDNEMLMQFVETTAELSKESEFECSGIDPNISSMEENDSAISKDQIKVQPLADQQMEQSLEELASTNLEAEDKLQISEDLDTLRQNKISSEETEERDVSHDAVFVNAIAEQMSSDELLESELTANVIEENAEIEEVKQVVDKLAVSPCKEMLTHETEISSSIELKVSEIISEAIKDNTINVKCIDEVNFDSASVQQHETFVNEAYTESCQLPKEQTDIEVVQHISVDQLEKKGGQKKKKIDFVKCAKISDVEETFTMSSNVNLTGEWNKVTQLEIEYSSCLLKTAEDPVQLEIDSITAPLETKESTEIEDDSTVLLKTEDSTGLMETQDSTVLLKTEDSSGLLESGDSTVLLKTEDSTGLMETQDSTVLLKTEDSSGLIESEDSTVLLKTDDSTSQLETWDSSTVLLETETSRKPALISEKIDLESKITEIEPKKQLEHKCDGETIVATNTTLPVQSAVTGGDLNVPEEEKPKKKRKKRRSPFLYGEDAISSSVIIDPVIIDSDTCQHMLPAVAETVLPCNETTPLEPASSKTFQEIVTDTSISDSSLENQLKETAPEIKDDISTQESIEAISTQESIEAISTQESIEAISTSESTEAISTQESIEVISTQESIEAISTQESIEAISTQESIEAISTQESIEAISTQESIEAISTQESIEAISTQESIEVISKQESIEAISTQVTTEAISTKCSPEEDTAKDIHPKKKKKKKKKSSLRDENETTAELKKFNQSSKKGKNSFSEEQTPDSLCKNAELNQKNKSTAASFKAGQIPQQKDPEDVKCQDDYPKTDKQLSSEEELQKEFVLESNEERTDECVYSLLPSETEIDVTTHQASMLEDVKGELIVENIHKTTQVNKESCPLLQVKKEQLSGGEDWNNLAFVQEKTQASYDMGENCEDLEDSSKPMLDKQVLKPSNPSLEGIGGDKDFFSGNFKDADFRFTEKSDKEAFVNISKLNENLQSEIAGVDIVSKEYETSSTSNTKITSAEIKKKRRSPFLYGNEEKSILSKGIEEFFHSTENMATTKTPLYVDSPSLTAELNVTETPTVKVSTQSFSKSEELKVTHVTTPEGAKRKKKLKKTSQVKFCEGDKIIPVHLGSSSIETSTNISVVDDKTSDKLKKDVSKTENKVSQTLSKVSSIISKKAQSVLEDSPIKKKKPSTMNGDHSEEPKTNSSILKLSKKKTKHKEVSEQELSKESCPTKESEDIPTDSSSINFNYSSSEYSQKKLITESEKLVKLEPVEEKMTVISIAPPISMMSPETESKSLNKENKEKDGSSTGKVAKSVVDKISSLVSTITKQVTDSLEELSSHKKKKLKQSSLMISDQKETEEKSLVKEKTESSNLDSKNKTNKKVLGSSLSEKSMRKVDETNSNSKQKSQKGNSSSKASPLLSKNKQKSKQSRNTKNIPISHIKIESPYREHTYLPLIHHLRDEEPTSSDTTPIVKRKKRQRRKKKHHNLSQLSTTTASSCEIDTALWLHSNKSSRESSSHQKSKIPPRPRIVISEDKSTPPLPLPRANSTPPTKRAGTPTSTYLSTDSYNKPRSRSRCRRSPVKELLWLSEQETLSNNNDTDSSRRARSLSTINRFSKINLAYISTGTRVRKRRKKNIIAVS